MNDVSVNIRPGVGMLGLFPHMKYKPWYALGELVDNAIQSYLSHRDQLRRIEGDNFRLKINIDIDRNDGGRITVRDNAAGISAMDWERAFRVADPPADNTGLSQFGIGMKAAACWFAREWTVRSSHLGEPLDRLVEFDVPRIVRDRDETLEVQGTPTSPQTHFTEIEMWDLNNLPQGRTLGKTKVYLGGIYRQFLRAGEVELRINGELIEYQEPAILDAPLYNDPHGESLLWKKDVEIHLSSGRVVTGYVGIRERGSTAEAGLALLYREKVVSGVGEETYRPEAIFGKSNSFRYQRVLGELNMNDFAVVYTKDALVWFGEEDEFLELLREALDEPPLVVLKQAEGYRARRPEPEPEGEHQADEVVASTGDLFPEGEPIDVESEPADAADPDAHPEPIGGGSPASGGSEPGSVIGTSFVREISGSLWTITVELISDEAVGQWLGVKRQDQGAIAQLTIRINQAHPFMRNFAEIPSQDLEPVWRLGLALGLAQEIVRDKGGNVSEVTHMVNKLLRKYLSRQV